MGDYILKLKNILMSNFSMFLIIIFMCEWTNSELLVYLGKTLSEELPTLYERSLRLSRNDKNLKRRIYKIFPLRINFILK